MTDLMEEIARAIIRSKGANIVASDAEWPATIAHYRKMVAKYPDYANAGGLVTGAMREARTALAAIDAAGFAIVPKEATESMAGAGFEVAALSNWKIGPSSALPIIITTWRAMVAAAPKVRTET